MRHKWPDTLSVNEWEIVSSRFLYPPPPHSSLNFSLHLLKKTWKEQFPPPPPFIPQIKECDVGQFGLKDRQERNQIEESKEESYLAGCLAPHPLIPNLWVRYSESGNKKKRFEKWKCVTENKVSSWTRCRLGRGVVSGLTDYYPTHYV